MVIKGVGVPLVTVADWRAHNVTQDQTPGGNADARIYERLVQLTRYIEEAAERSLIPYIATLGHHYRYDTQGRVLILADDMLEATTVTNGDETDVSTYKSLPVSGPPYDRIKLPAGEAWTYEDDVEDAITIAGLWGWGGDWESVGTLSAPLDASTSTLATAATLVKGHLLHIDDELLLVTVDSTGTEATASRGVRGSTATTHASGATLERWYPHPVAQRALLRLNDWAESQVQAPMFGTLVAGDATLTVKLDALPGDLQALISQMKRVSRILGV